MWPLAYFAALTDTRLLIIETERGMFRPQLWNPLLRL